MNWLSRILRKNAPPQRRTPPPNLSARVSIDSDTSLRAGWGTLFSDVFWLSAQFPFGIQDVINDMFLVDPNFGQYLSTTISLGNPGHDLEIDAPNERRADEATQVATDLAARCFPYAGGMDGLISGMLSQIARYGACCPEWVPDEPITQIQRAYLFPISSVRFRYDRQGELELGQLQDGTFVPLNPIQTTYHAAFMRDDSPYGVPPALAALQAVADHQQIHTSLRSWFNKLAVLGFLSMELERPEIEQGETTEEYRNRCRSLLAELGDVVQENLTSGIVLGFDDMKSTFQNTSTGAAGAQKLAELNDLDLFAGLGRPPSFFGRNYSTTDTWASVMFEQVSSELKHVQLGVKRAIETGHRLNFALSGLGDVGISVKFRQARSLNFFLDSEAEQMKSTAVVSQFKEGIIDRDEARRMLGHDQRRAKTDAFIASYNTATNAYQLNARPRALWNGAAFSLAPIPVDDLRENLFREAVMAARNYLKEVTSHLRSASRRGVEAVHEWARVRGVPMIDIFVSEALRQFIEGAEKNINKETLERIAKKHLKTLYTWSRREDNSIFTRPWKRTPPKIGKDLNIKDEEAIGYMANVDRFYASKFARDQQTQEEIGNWLRDEYIATGIMPHGDKKELQRFIARFGDQIEGITDHRARIIVETGISRAQNWGSLMTMHEQGFVEFRISGPWDKRTCNWCYALRDKIFRVDIEVERIRGAIKSGNEEIERFGGFLPSRYRGKEGAGQLKGMSSADIQARGDQIAPVHPLCRHRVIAHIPAEAWGQELPDDGTECGLAEFTRTPIEEEKWENT